jgi:hypothetical protein
VIVPRLQVGQLGRQVFDRACVVGVGLLARAIGGGQPILEIRISLRRGSTIGFGVPLRALVGTLGVHQLLLDSNPCRTFLGESRTQFRLAARQLFGSRRAFRLPLVTRLVVGRNDVRQLPLGRRDLLQCVVVPRLKVGHLGRQRLRRSRVVGVGLLARSIGGGQLIREPRARVDFCAQSILERRMLLRCGSEVGGGLLLGVLVGRDGVRQLPLERRGVSQCAVMLRLHLGQLGRQGLDGACVVDVGLLARLIGVGQLIREPRARADLCAQSTFERRMLLRCGSEVGGGLLLGVLVGRDGVRQMPLERRGVFECAVMLRLKVGQLGRQRFDRSRVVGVGVLARLIGVGQLIREDRARVDLFCQSSFERRMLLGCGRQVGGGLLLRVLVRTFDVGQSAFDGDARRSLGRQRGAQFRLTPHQVSGSRCTFRRPVLMRLLVGRYGIRQLLFDSGSGSDRVGQSGVQFRLP